MILKFTVTDAHVKAANALRSPVDCALAHLGFNYLSATLDGIIVTKDDVTYKGNSPELRAFLKDWYGYTSYIDSLPNPPKTPRSFTVDLIACPEPKKDFDIIEILSEAHKC